MARLFNERCRGECPVNILLQESTLLDEIKKVHLKQGAISLVKIVNFSSSEL